MVNIINSKNKKLSSNEDFDRQLKADLKVYNLELSGVNMLNYGDPEKFMLTPYGRALLSLLEELTGGTIARKYVAEKLNIMFEDE